MAAKAAAITSLEASERNLTLSLQETSEELQGAIESLEESYKVNAARLEDQLAALAADKARTGPPLVRCSVPSRFPRDRAATSRTRYVQSCPSNVGPH